MPENWELEQPVTEVYTAGHGEFVYFIQERELEDLATEPIKIGVAAWPQKRLRTLQTGNSRKLVVRQVILGGAFVETRLHRVWKRKGAQLRDEWFGKGYQRAILELAYEIALAQVAVIETGRRVEAGLTACVEDLLRVHRWAA